jgi:hypothetical protein
MRKRLIVLAAVPLLATGGCIRTVASVATAPFKVAGQTVDWATTSQDEADRNYGRKMRKKEAREGRERREYAKRCQKDRRYCGGYDGYQAAQHD